MPVDEALLQVGYRHTIRRLHMLRASLRKIADALRLGKRAPKDATAEDATAEAICTFCGREKSDAGALIAGPGVFICERCVKLAGELLAEDDVPSAEHTTLVNVKRGDVSARCSFCGKGRGKVQGMAEARRRPPVDEGAQLQRPGARVCDECVELCVEILDERRE